MPISLSLLTTSGSESLSGTSQSVSVVSLELGVNTLERGVSVSSGLLDPVSVGLLGLVVGGVVLGLGHIDCFANLFFAMKFFGRLWDPARPRGSCDQ